MLDQSFPRREPIGIGQPMEEQEKILRAGFFVPINTGIFLKILLTVSGSCIASVHTDSQMIRPVISSPGENIHTLPDLVHSDRRDSP